MVLLAFRKRGKHSHSWNADRVPKKIQATVQAIRARWIEPRVALGRAIIVLVQDRREDDRRTVGRTVGLIHSHQKAAPRTAVTGDLVNIVEGERDVRHG